MPKKFAEIKVGEQFKALGERFVKSGPLSYRSIDNPSMGEYAPGPILDRQIDRDASKSTIRNTITVTKDPEVDAVDRAVAAGQTTPIKRVAKKAKKH